MTEPEPLQAALARRVRELRGEMDPTMTQAELAEIMSNLGFGWKRLTVVDVELEKRRVSVGEWIGLATAFGVPAISLLEVPRGTKITVSDELTLSPQQVLRTIAGDASSAGSVLSTDGVAGLSYAFERSAAELETPMAALHKLVEVFEHRVALFERAAAFGDLDVARRALRDADAEPDNKGSTKR